MNPAPFNKTQLIQAFNRSAKTFHEAQMLEHEIGHRLLERLDLIKTHPKNILDIGAGDGELTHLLFQRHPQAKIVGMDIAKQRLFKAKKTPPTAYLCADVETLPLQDHSMDLIFSNLTLHWCSDLFSAFQHIRRILRPNGLFLFSMLGIDTLKEIRESWQLVDDGVHVYDFPDMHHVGDGLLQAGFQDPVMDMEHITLEHPNLSSLLSDLKKSGSTNLSPYRAQGLLSRERYEQFVNTLEQRYQSGKTLPVTFEIIYGYAISKFAIIQESSCASNTLPTHPWKG